MRPKIFATIVVITAAAAGWRDARADDKVVCVRAAEAAQEMRTAGKLKDARTSLHVCAREACPPLVRRDCTQWLAEVDASLPTIVLRAENARGEDVTDVAVELDGRRIADKLDGLPIEVDPGPHTLTFRHGQRDARGQDIVVRTAEKNRAVTLHIEPREVPPVVSGPSADAVTSEPRLAAWVFTGLAVAGAASFGYFGLRGSSDARELRDTCAGHCPANRVDAAHQKLLAADVSLGVALLSAGIATYLFWPAAPGSPKNAPAQELGVAPLSGGAAAVLLQRF
jgi:hypothetical protein